MDTDSFFIYIKIKDAYKGVTDDVKKRFDTPNYQVGRPLPTQLCRGGSSIYETILFR